MQVKWDTALTSILLVCALATTAIVVHREFGVPVSATQTAVRKPVYVRDWRSDVAVGEQIGSASAPIQIIEFADFECPFCGVFYKTLKTLRARYPTQLTLTYMHFPLRGHRFALPAARAAECARNQGQFEVMYDQLFDGQDQFGLKPWGEFAMAAGVLDLVAFDACIKKTEPIPRIEEGKELGQKLDVQGTPTLIINGWMLGRPPTEQELDQMVQRILAGKSPVDGKS